MANFPASLPSSTPADHGEVIGELRAIAGALVAIQTYAPTITASGGGFSTGTSPTVFGRYLDRGLYVEGEIFIHLGTAPSAGAGFYQFLLPIAAHADDITMNLPVASGYYYDVSTGTTYQFPAAVLDSTHLIAYVSGTIVALGAANPVVPAAGDEYRIQFRYRKA